MSSQTLKESIKIVPANLVMEPNDNIDDKEPTTPILTAPPIMLSPINSNSSSKSDTAQGSLNSLLEKINKNPSLTKVSSLKSVLSGSGIKLMKTNEDESLEQMASCPLLRPNVSEPEAEGLLQKLGSRSASFRADDISKVENKDETLVQRDNKIGESKEEEKTESSPPTPPLKNGHPLLMSCEGRDSSYSTFSINTILRKNDTITTENADTSRIMSGENMVTPSGEETLEKEENLQSHHEFELKGNEKNIQPNKGHENEEENMVLCDDSISPENSHGGVKVDPSPISRTTTGISEAGSDDLFSSDEEMQDDELNNPSTAATSFKKQQDTHYDADADTDEVDEDAEMDCHGSYDKSKIEKVDEEKLGTETEHDQKISNTTVQKEESKVDEVEEMDEENSFSEAAHDSAPEHLPTPFHVGPPPIEIVFSFDTTGSMSSYLDSLKLQLEHIIQRLFADIPNLKVGIIAHGDYCDKDMYYLLQNLDFSNNLDALCDFIKNAEGTGGGDWEECYELALRYTREKFSWTPGSQRSLVMIGDAIPHPKNDPQNMFAIDWQEEVKKLYNEMGVSIYAVQCEDTTSSKADYFWEEMAATTNGKHLKLNQFDDIVDLMMGICYRERGAEFFEAYEKEVRTREGPAIRHELGNLLEALGKTPKTKPSNEDKADFSVTPTTERSPSTSASVSTPSVNTSPPKKGKKNVTAVTVRRRPAVKKPSRKSRRLSGPTTRSMTGPQAGVSGLTMSPKKIKRIAQNKPKKVETEKMSPRVFRENVTDNHFTASDLMGRWYLVASPDLPMVDTKMYEPLVNGGFIRSGLFCRDYDYVFEIAASGRCPGKMVPLYLGTVSSLKKKWCDHLFDSEPVKKQVDNIISQGCSLFIRQAITSTPVVIRGKTCKNIHDIKTCLTRQYDYAWLCSGRKTPRNLTKKLRRSTIELSKSFE